jgi:hypothetical protein
MGRRLPGCAGIFIYEPRFKKSCDQCRISRIFWVTRAREPLDAMNGKILMSDGPRELALDSRSYAALARSTFSRNVAPQRMGAGPAPENVRG